MSAPDDRKLLIADRWWDKLPRAVYSTLERVPCSQDWFEVYKVKDGIYAIYEPYQYEEALCTLILGEEKAVLIDTGCGIGNIRDVVEEITDLPVMVVNSHAHNDHIAQNYLFDEVAMLDHPWSHEAEKGLPNSEMAHLIADGMLWKELPEGFDAENYVVPGFKVTHWFKEGAILDLGNVTNDGSSSDTAHRSMMYLEWDVVMIDNPNTNNGSTYWVSVGAEYNQQDEVWVGQASFKTIQDDFVSTPHAQSPPTNCFVREGTVL